MVGLSVFVAFLGAFAGLEIADRIKAVESRFHKFIWFGAGAAIMGCGFWAMHFIGMLALNLQMVVEYDLPTTMLSMAPAIFAGGVALCVLCRKTVGWYEPFFSGFLMAAGIGVMHYTGMSAMRMAAGILIDPALFAGSIIIAVMLAAFSLSRKFSFALNNADVFLSLPKVISALVMGAAVSAMHYTAMEAAVFFPTDTLSVQAVALNDRYLAASIGGVATGLIILANVASVVGRRLEAAFVFEKEIAERKHAEAAINDSLQKNTRILESIRDVFFTVDQDWRIIYANSLAREFFGKEEDFLGEILWHQAPEVVSFLYKNLTKAMKEKEPASFEGFYPPRSAWFDTRAFPTDDGVSVYLLDVTDRKKAEAALKESEARLRDVAEASSDFFWEADENFRYTFVSRPKAWIEVQKFPGGNLIGKTRWEALGIEPEKDETWRHHIEHMKARKPFRNFRVNYTDKTGRVRYWHVSGKPYYNSSGAFRGYRGFNSEITEQVESDESLRRALVLAEEANQAKSAFLATMSHELRTPLNAILGFGEILSHQYLGPLGGEKYQECAENICTSSYHLLALVNDILDLSAIDAGKQSLEVVKISFIEVVEDCVKVVAEPMKRKNIKFTTKVSKDLPDLYADRRAIKQIVLNILSNAVKFTPEQGTVTLVVTASDESHIIKIIDSGPGVPEEKTPRLTEPFVKAGNDPYVAGEGTGLGLAIVDSLVKLHEGELKIESKVGEGTKVTVILPNGVPAIGPALKLVQG